MDGDKRELLIYGGEEVEQIVTYLIVVQQLSTCPKGLETQTPRSILLVLNRCMSLER